MEHPSAQLTFCTVHPFARRIPLHGALPAQSILFAQSTVHCRAALQSWAKLRCRQHPDQTAPWGGGSLPHQAPAATPPLPLAPGFVNTELFRHLPLWLKPLFVPLAWLFFRDAAEGAETSLFCATQEGLERFSGRYFADCRLQEPWPHARDDAVARELWEASERLVGLAP